MQFFHNRIFLPIFICLISIISTIHTEEETCDLENGCDEKGHNVWEEDYYPDEESKLSNLREKSSGSRSITAEESVLEYLKENGVSMKPLELVLLLNHLDQGDDGRVDKDDLEAVQEIQQSGGGGGIATMRIVQSVVKSFGRLDKNDDGKLTKEELPVYEMDDEDDDDVTVTVAQYLEILSKLDNSVAKALEPFLGLGFLSPFEMKTVIARSISVFKDKDEDASGGLNMEEYLAQVDRPDNPKAQLMDQGQKESIFGMIDKDGDGEISYTEFLAVIPKGPPTMPTAKDMDGIFNAADKNGDGYWSREEFEGHLRGMVLKTGAPEPKLEEISEAFSHLDADQDGQVSKEEMQGIQKQIEKIQEEKAMKGFSEMDLDGDGVLTRTEMETMATVMEGQVGGKKVDVDTLIKMMDKNGNGVIELEEVTEMVHRMIPPTNRKQ